MKNKTILATSSDAKNLEVKACFNKDLSEVDIILRTDEELNWVKKNASALKSASQKAEIEIVDSGFDNSVENDEYGQVYCYLYTEDDGYRFMFKKEHHNIVKLSRSDIPYRVPINIIFYENDTRLISLTGVVELMQTDHS